MHCGGVWRTCTKLCFNISARYTFPMTTNLKRILFIGAGLIALQVLVLYLRPTVYLRVRIREIWENDVLPAACPSTSLTGTSFSHIIYGFVFTAFSGFFPRMSVGTRLLRDGY